MNDSLRMEPVARFDLEAADHEVGSESVWPALERAGFLRTEAVRLRVEALLPLGEALISPRATGRMYPAETLSATDVERLPAPIREAEFLCFGLCTAGRAIDEQARALRTEGELIDSMILDAIALTGLSQISDRLGRAIFGWAEDAGMSASRAFSPGAGSSGWELENQRFVFAHLPENPLEVELTSHYLMRPSKSVSFVIGIGKRVKQAAYAFSCRGCDRVDCSYRHVPGSEMVNRSEA